MIFYKKLYFFLMFFILTILSFNISQDPFNHRANVSNSSLEMNMYPYKLNHIKNFKPSSLIIGDSIVADGINPQSYFGNDSYNASVYGIHMLDVEKYFNEITQTYIPTNILFSINIGQLNLNRPEINSYDRFNQYSGNIKKSKINLMFVFIKNHFDFIVFKSAVQIFLGKGNSFNAYGFNSEKNKNFGKYPTDRTIYCNASIKELEKDLIEFSTRITDKDTIESVQKVLEKAYFYDINLEILFPPFNKLAYDKINQLNLIDRFNDIKKTIININLTLANSYNKKPFKLLDLSNINEITSNDCGESIYYRDAMHITPKVGDIIKDKFANL